jgi:hypothetical protein
MLLVLDDGRKLTPFIILKRKNLSKEIIFKYKGWMMKELLMVKWLREVWHRRKSAALPKKRGIVVLDSFKGH